MPNVNVMILQGHFGKDPETKYLASGDPVCNFSVAYSYKKDAPTTWFRCSAFGKTAEMVAKYFTKGSAPLLQGSMSSREYQNKEGQNVTAWDFRVEKILDFGPRKEGQAPKGQAPKKEQRPADDFDDDIPF